MSQRVLLIAAATFQVFAVVYAIYLMRRRAGRAAWVWLLGSMLAMLIWRLVFAFDFKPPAFFTPTTAMCGSFCMLVSMFLFAKEVARREAAEVERDALLASERAARESSERANRFKDQFLGALSHELRTPLTAIIGWCDLTRIIRARSPVSEEAGEAFEVIERNARALARLVDDLLDVTRITAGTLRLDTTSIPLAQPIRAAIETVQSAAEKKSIVMNVSLDESILVVGDPLRLQQVFWNLLSNAVKFTPEGGRVEVVAERSAITEGRGHSQPIATVIVRDTGIGILPEFMPHLFTRFRQADGAIDRKYGGLGMGLSIARTLIEAHSGMIRGDSEGRDRGSTFTITLPTATDAAGSGASAAGRSRDRKALSRLSVVVLDDEPDIRIMVQRVLESNGAVVRAAATAEEAAHLIDTIFPQVLVSDIGMPGTDGYTFLRRLRTGRHPRNNGLKAVAVTAYSRDVDRQLAIDSGFDAHVTKPIDANQLVSTIARLTSSPAAAEST